MAIGNWFRRSKPQAKLTDEELRAALRQQVMSDLSRKGGLNPVYRDDILSEAEFEARMAELPLLVVWNERDTDQGLAFSMSVNVDKVAAVIERYILRADPWFREEYCRLVNELRTSSHSALMKTVATTGAPPSRICEALSAL